MAVTACPTHLTLIPSPGLPAALPRCLELLGQVTCWARHEAPIIYACSPYSLPLIQDQRTEHCSNRPSYSLLGTWVAADVRGALCRQNQLLLPTGNFHFRLNDRVHNPQVTLLPGLLELAVVLAIAGCLIALHATG